MEDEDESSYHERHGDEPTIDLPTPTERRVLNLMFDGLTAAMDGSWWPVPERQRIASIVYYTLRAGRVEFEITESGEHR